MTLRQVYSDIVLIRLHKVIILNQTKKNKKEKEKLREHVTTNKVKMQTQRHSNGA